MYTPKREAEMKIESEKDTKPKMGPLYKLSVSELPDIQKQIHELLAKGYIRTSFSLGAVQFYFTKKKDRGLWMCIDYRALKNKTIKTKYHFLELMKWGIQLEVRNASVQPILKTVIIKLE